MQDDEYANLLNEKNPFMIYTLSNYHTVQFKYLSIFLVIPQ